MASASEHSSIPRRDSGTASRPTVNLCKAGKVQAQTDDLTDPHQQSAQTSVTKSVGLPAQDPHRLSLKWRTCKFWKHGKRCPREDATGCSFAHHLFPTIKWQGFDKPDNLERCPRGTDCRSYWLNCNQNHMQEGSELDLYRIHLREYIRDLPYTAITVVRCNACGTTFFNVEEMLNHLQTQHPESYDSYNALCPAPHIPEGSHDGSVDRG
ncbi:hypothetical protein HII31_05056 [Pseudocercospora fuligena]|uniref:C3H1-type domain-containing protein n=1 Tax=Pseudocercospora fuligena TaxID=685502 RepID=A0A8H6RMD4_9PEZI|nr:hypothetical protein HII31_05056 [Pseudocercospora fuligena]